MSLAKVVAVVGAIVAIEVAVLLIIKPPLTVKSVEVTDIKLTAPIGMPDFHYPAIKISFKADKWPVFFQLMKVVESYVPNPSEEVAYLAIGGSRENIAEPRSYVVRAIIDNKEVFKREIDLRGLSGSVRILNASITTYSGLVPEPMIEKILIKVENSGDVPLYLAYSSPPPLLSVDGASLFFKPSKEIIMPGSEEEVELSITPIYPDKEHVFTILVPGIGISSYTTEPLRPEVRVENVGLRPNYPIGSRSATPVGYFLDNVTITVRNTEAYPISFLHHFEVYVGDKKATVLPSYVFLNPGEKRTLTIGCDLYVEKKPSEVRVKLYGTEVTYRVSEG
jgi:hypothetical protein